jgi:hypothetical protein
MPKGKTCDCRGPKEVKLSAFKKVFEASCFGKDDNGTGVVKAYQAKAGADAMDNCNRFCPNKK